MTLKQEFAAVVDIGTSKITGLAGELNENGRIEILAQASAGPRGIKRGLVLNPEEFAGALRSLINDLENQCGSKIRVVDVSMAGQGITTIGFEGIRYIESGIVSQADVDYLRNEATNMPLEPGFRIYHLSPVDYEIGEETNVTVPVGHEGRKMKARYTLVVAPSSYQDNVEKALARTGLQLGRFILSPLALSEAAITEEEKDLGVVLVDIGCGTTKIISWAEGKLTNLAVIPFAGDAITHDIREGCSIIQKWAEQLKTQYGEAMGDFADEDKVVTIPGHNGWEPREISFKSLAFIIQARLEEIIDSIYFQIEKSGFKTQSAQGIIVTGGTSKLANLLQLVKFRTGMDARLGFSQIRLASTAEIDKTRYLNALGLLQMSLKDSMPARPRKVKSGNEGNNGFFSTLGKKMTQQFSLLFEDDDTKM